MSNGAGVRHYFAEGLTTRGYISLLPDMMVNWQRTYVLLGGLGTGKSTLIKVIGMELLDRGYEIDFLRSAREPDSMAGFILQDLGFAMLNAMEISPLRWRAPGVVEKFVDLGTLSDDNKLGKRRPEILDSERKLFELQLQVEEELVTALGPRFGKGYVRQSSLEESSMHSPTKSWKFSKGGTGVWPLAQHALQQLQKSVITPCFLHGLTVDGWLNLAPHFLADCDQIRLEGEETMAALNWILREAQLLGQVIKIVLHPLNPDEVIGIVFPQRNLAIWQGNPENLNDQELEKPFSVKLKEGLAAMHSQRAFLKKIYRDTVDFDKIDQLRDELLNSILRDADYFSQKG